MFEKLKEIKELKKEFQEKSKLAFKEGCRELFDAFPQIEEIRIQGYTPYFNDGDPCYFRLREPTGILKINGELKEFNCCDYASDDVCQNIIYEFYNLLDADDILSIFGDNIELVIRKDKVKAINYTNHD